jgi:hypothetical protein
MSSSDNGADEARLRGIAVTDDHQLELSDDQIGPEFDLHDEDDEKLRLLDKYSVYSASENAGERVPLVYLDQIKVTYTLPA